jgi:hypothetical protein
MVMDLAILGGMHIQGCKITMGLVGMEELDKSFLIRVQLETL